MQIGQQSASEDQHNWICPDISPYWQLSQLGSTKQYILRSRHDNRHIPLSPAEVYALSHFTGIFTVTQIQQLCQQKFGSAIAPHFVVELLQKLINIGILTSNESITPKLPISDSQQRNLQHSNSPNLQLKSCIQWIPHADGYWILRNPEDVTFLQVDSQSKAAINQLGKHPPADIAKQNNLSLHQLRYLLQLLTATGMLAGTKPAKPPKRKFTPLQLLFFKVPLFNPDSWLTQHIHKLHWIWTRPFALILCFFLAFSLAISLSQRPEIILTGQQLVANQGASLMLPFALLAMLVVTLHELGHAFTLKHYNGIVPEVGLLFMFLMPAAYTNTTDSYCLSRFKRILVVGAGVLCQLIIAATAFWLWQFSAHWLATTNYLLMVAALFTIALNLNPLAKFDGYYLAVALTGINNLRSRSFQFYGNLLRGRPNPETSHNSLILATYAPFSFLYILLVFGSIFTLVTNWTLTNIPFWTATLLTIWAIYYYFPQKQAGEHRSGGAGEQGSRGAGEPGNKSLRAPLRKPLRTSAFKKNQTITPPNINPPQSQPLNSKINMNASQQTPSLQVVPPSTKPTPSNPPTHRLQRFALLGTIATSLCLISLIPTSFEVGGAVELQTREGAREVIRAPMPGVVTEIHVQPGETVQPGQILAQLSSLDLDREIAATEHQLVQADQILDTTRKQRIRAEAQLLEVQAVAEAMQEKTRRESLRATAITQGQLTPEIQVLDTQRQRLQERIPELEEKLQRYQQLYEQGAISRNRRDEIESELRDIESSLAAKTQEINAAQQNQTDTASDLQTETVSQLAAIDASQMIATAESEMMTQQKAIATLKNRLSQLKTLRENLTLRSPMAGVVLTSDLDLRKNQELKPGEDFLLEIAELNELTATVDVKEEDLEYVELNKPVTFRPRQAKLRPYSATVKRILPKIQNEPSQPQRLARVQIFVNNSDGKLYPGATGYAKIWSERIPLYQRLGRELMRLVPLERFLWTETEQ
ncbi:MULTISPECIES: efflux RND transporter periplasmic adaptor subunit [unclassified Coleofasciculus]|uniref:efflux RND transporter periplasmic adaptor subunit n=1 Tax=unclassified Coleofasciculus TaxID=2692782 RepID=UPI0018809DF4|nr:MULTISPECIES: efflux RND transporter periplasmic adaptor subunit [unclassified Coleofasciculus]MBE9126922.1 efflux RND transporter periplasmic adaptor subunit [Coleofasciculus sp. LEGE 07081]MBE9148667.1 efflux RND transporter periplasmic adaptor subunit [Coleofasciculus sp. LEGE 07092]